MARYDWLMKGLAGDVDPQVAGEHIESLIEKYQEHLTCDEILADARKTSSPIHNVFEWDDTTAAEKHRRNQASSMMAGLVIKNKRQQKTRAFVFVQIPGENRRKSYIPLRSAMGRTELREQVIKQALKPLERWIASYGGRSELSFVKKRVEQLRQRIEAELLASAGLSR